MAEHHNKQTLAATYWCRHCSKPTLHSVYDGRKGACLACIERLEKKEPPKKPVQNQENFWP